MWDPRWLQNIAALVWLASAFGPTGCRCQGQPLDGRPAVQAPTVAAAPKPPGAASGPTRRAITVAQLQAAIPKLAPLHERIRKPGPGDWLSEHAEPGQTFAQYLTEDPVTPDLEPGEGKRHKLAIQPLGPLTPTQRKLVKLTSQTMEAFFGLPVEAQSDLPLSVIPERARRTHPSWGVEQILSTYVLDDVLKPRLPDDAAAYISFTAIDLWPGKGWNFVFGQASLRGRVGVWSIYRNGDPDESEASFRLALLRTIKTAVHETGHMFSMRHCTAYECVMCGSNNREESDRRPVWLCPECVAKVSWATQTPLTVRYGRLAKLAEAHGFTEQAVQYHRAIHALQP
jgi:archaemetzincin